MAAKKYHTEEERKAAKAEANRRWYAANSEKVRANAREWYAANSEKVRANARELRAKNPDKSRARTREWKAKNPDKVRANALVRSGADPNDAAAQAAFELFGTGAEFDPEAAEAQKRVLTAGGMSEEQAERAVFSYDGALLPAGTLP